MSNAAPDPNEQNYTNTNLDRVNSSNADNVTIAIPQMSFKNNGIPRTPVYASRTALNATTGQSEVDTMLIIP